MYISDFQYHKPNSIQEACRILAESTDGVPLAGGTDLLVEIKQGLRQHQDIVSFAEIKEIKSIDSDSVNVCIGAGVTHNDLILSPVIQEKFPSIADSASKIGTDQIRNTGTIGGNLCTGASCCDMAPILLALDAKIEISDYNNTRTIPLKDFFISHKVTVLKKGEILKKIIVPMTDSSTGAWFEKFGLREAASIAVASVAVKIKADNDICSDVCLVIGAVAPTPRISYKANNLLIGTKLSKLSEQSSVLKQAGEAAAEDSLPIDDIRGTVAYRRDLIIVLTKRAVIKAVDFAIK